MTDSEHAAHPQRDFDSYFTAGRFALFLAFLIAVTFPAVLFGARTFIFRDFGMFSYPCAYFHRECFWRGEMPLWNPLNYCGVPFLAQWNTVTLYPLSLIYLLFPVSWSLSFFCLFHLFLAGLGMYFLAYRWTGNRLAACIAGVAFFFNGMSLSLLIWLSHTAAYALMPWVVLLVERAWNVRQSRSVALGALVSGMQLLTGSPEIILFTWMIVGGLAIAAAVSRQAPLLPMMICVAVIVAAAALLSAAQLLPFFEMLKYSQRDATYADSGWAMPPWGWANLIVPLFRTVPTPQDVWFQYGQHWASSYYPGIAILFLSVLGLIRTRDWRTVTLFVFTLLGLVLALGEAGFLFGWVRQVFPAIGFIRYPVKFMIFATFAFPLLAAFAIARREEKTPAPNRVELLIVAALVLLIGVVLWIGHAHPMPKDNWPKTWQNGVSSAVLLAVAFAIVTALNRLFETKKVLASVTLLALLWLDLRVNVPSQNPTAERWVFEPGWVALKLKMQPEPAHGQSRAMPGPAADAELRRSMISDMTQHYMVSRLTLFSDCNLVDGFPKVNGFFSLYPYGPYALVAQMYSNTNRTFTPLMDFLSVSQTSSSADMFEWTNRPTFMPMATIGQRPIFAEATNTFPALLQTNIDLRKVVYLPTEARAAISVTNTSEAQVISSEFRNQRIAVETEAKQRSLLVLSQTHYPAWKAYVDGRPAKIWRANYAFQAVEVPAGRHAVLLRYEDRKFYTGAVISGLAFVTCVVGLAKRPRKSS